jgi:hypothetical protein
MDLNHIELPSSLVSELYRSVLVEEPSSVEVQREIATETLPEEKAPAEMKFLGENKKNILMVVRHPEVVHVPDNELSFLVAMLTACKLTLADVAIVNIHNQQGQDQKKLVENFKSRVVFLFGIDPVSFGLPLSFPEFQIQAFAGATYLFTPPLSELENDKELKRKLWESLKRLFVV